MVNHNCSITYIECPHCNTQYTPSEIFIPTHFLGHTEYVKRDLEGRIQSIAGTDMDLTETFVCDCCNKSFNISARVTFETSVCDEGLDTTKSIPFVERFKLKEF